MKDFNWIIFLLFCLEIFSLWFVFENFIDFFIMKLSHRNGSIFKEFNIIHDGVLVLKNHEESYDPEFYNNKFLDFFEINTKKVDFKALNHKISGFFFQKIKQNINDNDDSMLSVTFNSNQSNDPFETLKDLIKFYQANNQEKRDNTALHFIQMESQKPRLKLTMKREFFQNEHFYYFSFRKIEKIMTLKNKYESKNRLLNSFTHELKTPLNGSIPILQEIRNQLSTTTTIYIDRAIASLKLLENSLNNIIDYSLTISDQFIIHLSTIDFEEMLSEIFLTVKSQIELKGLDFTIDIDEDLINRKIMTDYNRLKQLILNVLLNSLQFTMKGSINLSVFIISNEPFIMEFTIEDTGMGIAEEKLNKLKNKLKEGEQNEFQMNSTGFCLGLVICQNIAILLGKMDLDISSIVDEGTTVKFLIIDQSKKDAGGVFNSNGLLSDGNIIESNNKNNENNEKNTNNRSLIPNKKRKIRECSKMLHQIRAKNIAIQKSIKEPLMSCSVSENEDKKMAANCSDNELNLGKYVNKYDFEKVNILLNKNLDHKHKLNSLKTFTEIKKEENGHILERKNPNMIHSKTVFSLKSIASSPGLRPNTSGFKRIHEEEAKYQQCLCEEILIVDDDAFNLLSLEMVLKGFQFNCAKALNGFEAITKIKNHGCESQDCKHGFQLIFMDYQMPVLNGVKTTMEIMRLMQEKEVKNTPIIGCTAFIAKDEISNCLNAGMKDVIFKPLSKNIIANILKEWI